MMADSGSFFTLINLEKYKKLQNVQLKQSNVMPVAYGGNPIDVVEEIGATLDSKGNQTQTTVYVARTGVNLLGWMDQKKLEIVLDPNSEEQVMVHQDVINLISANLLKRKAVLYFARAIQMSGSCIPIVGTTERQRRKKQERGVWRSVDPESRAAHCLPLPALIMVCWSVSGRGLMYYQAAAAELMEP
ncbi:hypothetical protein NDU88_007022 [Pleurodeles waltl]|uniref:Uncharacterized protein n=1 Tax=Pleurodeles waltl TaxID=8319 RepID=A0AAV7N151_PLEWA|nr:hypothetical protein NDU88_007022 [Pleurodeles waltl]